jgi:hypothetical protein
MNIFRKFSDAQDTIDAQIRRLKRDMKKNDHDKYLEIRRLQARRRKILNASADFYRNMNRYTKKELNGMAQNDVNTVVNYIKYWSNV